MEFRAEVLQLILSAKIQLSGHKEVFGRLLQSEQEVAHLEGEVADFNRVLDRDHEGRDLLVDFYHKELVKAASKHNLVTLANAENLS